VSLRPAVRIPEQLDGIEGWKVALSIQLGDFPVEPGVVTNTYAAADALRQAGAQVKEVELGWKRADILRASWAHFATIFAPAIRHEYADRLDLLMPYTRDFIEISERIAQDTSYLEGLEIEADIYAELGALLEEHDVLVCPTSGVPALEAGEDYIGTPLVVNDEELGDYMEVILTPVFNIASRCPVLAAPSGRADNGVPTGIQIVGPTYDDEKVFRVAAALEQVRPWFSDLTWRPPL
jgi:aspartyl-tRNA(Asn)/glutamyl-tRNA(Gln) amidotransferase subunit A